jgi:hypothetical protein
MWTKDGQGPKSTASRPRVGRLGSGARTAKPCCASSTAFLVGERRRRCWSELLGLVLSLRDALAASQLIQNQFPRPGPPLRFRCDSSNSIVRPPFVR